MNIRLFAFSLCCLIPGIAFGAATLPEISQLFRQGQNAQALEKVNGYLAASPKDPQGRFLKGLILAEMNRSQDAIRIFNDLTNDYPELPEPYNNLAVLYASQGQYDKAKGSLEKAIRTHPTYATAHENLGDIYAKMASVAYDKALQLDKGNASAQMKLALAKEIFTPASVDKAKPATRPTIVAKAPEPARTTPVATQANEPVTSDARAAGSPEKAVEDWAAAWTRQDVAAYLASYSPNFKTPKGMSRGDWETQRTQRVNRPEFIRVTVSDVRVSGNNQRATVSFNQMYESNLLKNSMRKTLAMEKLAGTWKIVSER